MCVPIDARELASRELIGTDRALQAGLQPDQII
jgi:hypothetical protein